MKTWYISGSNLPRLEIVSNSMDNALAKARQIDENYDTCQLKDIKLMDLSIGGNGHINKWKFGFFEECSRMSGNTFKDEDYTILDGYRIRKRDYQRNKELFNKSTNIFNFLFKYISHDKKLKPKLLQAQPENYIQKKIEIYYINTA